MRIFWIGVDKFFRRYSADWRYLAVIVVLAAFLLGKQNVFILTALIVPTVGGISGLLWASEWWPKARSWVKGQRKISIVLTLVATIDFVAGLVRHTL